MVKMLPRLPSENNINYSYRAIKEAILSLELKPGQLLSVGELAEALKVSSTPIKNALWKLQQEHLVDLIPQVGSYVSEINPELVEEAACMWFDLEKEYLKLACDNFPEESFNRLKRIIRFQELLLDSTLDQGELARKFDELDDNFHSTIFHSHHRNNTWKAISQMASDYHRMFNLTRSEHCFEDSITEHKNILAIIENKEAERVEAVLRNHILKPVYDWKEIGDEYLIT
ncbi:GntR family transcriptional regulator [Bacillus sp. AGMB 02131]|uniref:GntR family transcriptional regulator n=1 Tax=Peribacillus faecalis TaxID=2772559 RepID=A0A927D163_9BACI|nr:GntR family transcriptional regulator [Peribacillus faecalis]MBD3109139.1 GntR family transcriptional regulator [Peribacillus faecalis]